MIRREKSIILVDRTAGRQVRDQHQDDWGMTNRGPGSGEQEPAAILSFRHPRDPLRPVTRPQYLITWEYLDSRLESISCLWLSLSQAPGLLESWRL